jgi:hypothetical protein
MEKGNWGECLIEACCRSEKDENKSTAVYVGVSAGAILAGHSMQTACWKVRGLKAEHSGIICGTCQNPLLPSHRFVAVSVSKGMG